MLIKKILIIEIIILFLVTCITPSVAIINVKKSVMPFSNGNILYVGGSGPDNYTRIKDAIDNASDGDTVFVYNGTYSGNLKVNKSINLIGEDKNTTIIDGGIVIDADNVKVSGFRFTQRYSEIYISNNYNNIISGNVLVGCGIKFWNAGNNIISDNEIWFNQYIGIQILQFSFNNTIINNFIYSSSYFGIYFQGSVNNNIISSNYIESALFGIYFTPYTPFQNPDNNDVIKNYITWCGSGLYLKDSYGGNISNNTFIKNSVGIGLEGSHPDIISGNYFIENSKCALRISGLRINKIIQNTFINNTKNAFFNNCFYNVWDSNYWGKSRTLPYPIFGYFWNRKLLHILGVNFDWHPAKEPYDIPT